MISRVFAIMRKEFLHIMRDPPTLVLMFAIPIIQIILMGYSATTKIEDIAITVLDEDQSATSQRIINTMNDTSYFQVHSYVLSEEQGRVLLDRSEVRGMLIIPKDYGKDLAAGEQPEIEFVIDGSDPGVANNIIAAALRTTQELSRTQLSTSAPQINPAAITGQSVPGGQAAVPPSGQIPPGGQSPSAGQMPTGAQVPPGGQTIPAGQISPGGQTPPQAAAGGIQIPFMPRVTGIRMHPTVLYNPELESVNYMIPALMGMILQFLATLVTSMAIVRERERGTIEQLIVTPVRAGELIIGKVTPYLLVAFIEFLEVLLIGMFWFKVPIAGSIPLLMGLSALFLVGALGLGILISTAAHTQQEAMLMSFLVLMPSIFLSGFFFPTDAMPLVLQAISYLVPLRYMLIIVRGIALKGVGLEVLQGDIITLVIFCVLILAAAAMRFRKSLD
jgi:ABC-type multidrug transport system permease subunit